MGASVIGVTTSGSGGHTVMAQTDGDGPRDGLVDGLSDGQTDGHYDGDRRAAAPRIVGLAVLVVLAVVAARARAAGMTPPVHPPNGSATQIVIRIVALTVMVAAAILLVGGRRIRKIQVPGAGPLRKKVGTKPSRRVLIAALVGLLFAFVMQILGNSVNDQKRPPPPSDSAQEQVQESKDGRQPPPPGQQQHGLADEIILVGALLTLGVLIVVLVRRRTEWLEEEPEEDEDEAMAEAMRAAREAVLDRTITDPRSAIVACFAAMEGALAERGGAVTPQDSDTPSEVLHRGIERASLPETPAFTLLRLFREARFSTHPMTDRDRGDADDSLGQLLGSLGSPVGERSGGAP